MHAFGEPPAVETVPDPPAPADGVVVAVRATGVCRSDWHGWMGHDPAISLPHVPGHELAGEVAEVGPEVRGFAVGDRVTVPFCCGCGSCEPCRHGLDADLRRRLPARLHRLGLVRRAGRAPARGPQPRPPPGLARLRRGGEPRLPLHDRLRGADRRARRRLGRGARLRRPRPVGGDDRPRARRRGGGGRRRSPRRSSSPARSAPRTRSTRERARPRRRRSTSSPAAAPTSRSTRSAAPPPAAARSSPCASAAATSRSA